MKPKRICSIVGCGLKHSCKGFCAKHYKHFKNTGRACSVDGCNRRYDCSGYCSKHYTRFRVHGDPLFTKLPRGNGNSFEERFRSRIDKTPGLGPNGKCWEWTGKPNASGYGTVSFQGTAHATHRVAWYLKYKKWPEQLLRHKCDNPKCCRTSHLLEGNHQDNANDMKERGRQSHGEHRPNAKLTDDIIRRIRATPKTWGFMTKLAAEYGIDTARVSRIYYGKIWKHVK